MRKVKVGKYFVPLWLIVVVLVAGVGASAYYVWQTLTICLEVKEPLEIVSYPRQLSLYPGETVEFNVTIRNHASVNYSVYLMFSLDNLTYQEAYVTFSDKIYSVIPGVQNLTASLYVLPNAPPLDTTLTVNICRVLPFKRISSGCIFYDTFSASNGMATDNPWSIARGNWSVEDGKFKCVGTVSGLGAYAYPSLINVSNLIWEAKVNPIKIIDEGPEIILQSCRGEPLDRDTPGIVFDYYYAGKVLRVMVSLRLHEHSTYETRSFIMETNRWYAMKVYLFGSNIKCYLNDALIFDVTDPNIESFKPFRLLHGGCNLGEEIYFDDVKIWKSNIIVITNLKPGQRVELYDHINNLVAFDVVEIGDDKAVLDVSMLSFPFSGYFKIYADNGVTLLYRTPLYNDIWGGDQYPST